jgi:hypothetical protein
MQESGAGKIYWTEVGTNAIQYYTIACCTPTLLTSASSATGVVLGK